MIISQAVLLTIIIIILCALGFDLSKLASVIFNAFLKFNLVNSSDRILEGLFYAQLQTTNTVPNLTKLDPIDSYIIYLHWKLEE